MNALVGTVRKGCMETWRQPGFLAAVAASKVQYSSHSTEAVVAAKIPCRVKVTGGKRYSWCACGQSKKQPFCDGAHKAKAPSITPLRFTPEKDITVLLCACKQTRNAPYCDGTHFKVIYKDLVTSVKNMFK